MGKRGPAPTPIHKREVFVKLTIDNLKAAPYNPRKIDGPSLKALGFSLQEFGDISGITWNKQTKNLVCGHQRLEALKKEFGLLEVEGGEIVASQPNTGGNGAILVQRFPVRVVDWDLAKEKAANVAANSQFLAGEFTDDLGDILKGIASDLPEAFEKLRLNEFDLPLMGLDEGNTDPDAVPDVPEKPKTKTGDLYILGNHRLLCGDATKKKDVERLMDGAKADMVFTDPPYNVDYGSSKNPRHKIRKIANDSMPSDAWESFCKDVFANIKTYCAGDVYVWGASAPDGMKMRLWLHEMGCHWSATIIWKKQQLVLSPAKYQRIYEPCFYGWFGKSSYRADRKQVEVWEFDRPLNSHLHPTMKPVALCCRGIINSSEKNDIVLDLFGGSGSTLVACEQTQRRCYMMEIDPHYCDVIVKRWEDFTGKKVRHG